MTFHDGLKKRIDWRIRWDLTREICPLWKEKLIYIGQLAGFLKAKLRAEYSVRAGF